MNRLQLREYIRKVYSAESDFPWAKYPTNEVFRHNDNRKWFAVILKIPKSKLGLKSDESIDIIDLKCDPLLIGSLVSEQGIFPGYHMNKNNWITVALDGSVADDKIKMLLDISYAATSKKLKHNNKEE